MIRSQTRLVAPVARATITCCVICLVIADWMIAGDIKPIPLRAAVSTADPDAVAADVALELHASGFVQPLDIAAPKSPLEQRLFVVEQGGLIHAIGPSGERLPGPFLDIRDKVISGGERGLLAMTFDPDYAANGRFYVFYSRVTDGATVVSRFTAAPASAGTVDPSSEFILLVVSQPYTNHNGGDLNFGPDGFLYISLGDGGSGGDPQDRAQNLETLLGKLLRIDVNPQRGLPTDCGLIQGSYSIPADNPFQDGLGGDCDEIWAYGLRNPWRFSIDPNTNDLFVADVGQGKWEEVNVMPLADSKGANFGWRCFEGPESFNSSGCSGNMADYEFPQFYYPHGAPDDHCSVSGGEVYRGGHFPAIAGHYFAADFCSGFVWGLFPDISGMWQSLEYGSLLSRPTSFGLSGDGEMFVTSWNSGNVYHVIETTPGPWLEIANQGPMFAPSLTPITYTLTVSNSGSLPATQLLISDTLPSNSVYVGSSPAGVLTGNTVRWSIPSLASGAQISVQLAISTTKTIRNEAYEATAQGGYSTVGREVILTIIDPVFVFLPTVPGG